MTRSDNPDITGVVYGTVQSVQDLTPRLRRIVLGGDGLADYVPSDDADQYVNVLIVPDGAPYEVPFDVDRVRMLPTEHTPKGRRYTVRAWDPVARTVTIDFVVHGDFGFAGRWATHAQVGDRLQFTGPSGGYSPDHTADWYLLAGDESALPAIGASLERVPVGATVHVVAVVDDANGELAMECPGDVALHWIHRRDLPTPNADEAVVATLAAIDFPAGRADVFIHGEGAEIRAARRFLIAERGIDKATASISPYWRRGCDDEAWREIKQDFVAAMQTDG